MGFPLAASEQEGYLVMEGLEKGIEAQVTGELDPFCPGCGSASCASWRDSLQDGSLSNADVTAETTCFVGVQR